MSGVPTGLQGAGRGPIAEAISGGRTMTSQIKSYSVVNKLTDSAGKMSRRLTADVDAWAEARDTLRSDAIRQLVELGLSSSSVDPLGAARRDSVEIEDLAVEQIGQLLDRPSHRRAPTSHTQADSGSTRILEMRH